MSSISIIAAMSPERVIGRDNKLPWHVKSDLQNFRELTLKKPVIMGRKTFESLGAPLQDRTNIVVTRDPYFAHQGVEVFGSIDGALSFARGIPASEIMVIGGEQIFEATLESANKMYITIIDKIINDGDAYFPTYDKSQWEVIGQRHLSTINNEPKAEFFTYQKKRA
jgi:dihydrofolate reductase